LGSEPALAQFPHPGSAEPAFQAETQFPGAVVQRDFKHDR
jgi:hypothetical protein